MEAYFSYWSGGYQNSVNQNCIDLHSLSVFLAKKHYKKVHLISDTESAEKLKHLNFDTITPLFDDLSPKFKQIWGISKIKAFEYICSKGDPFIHIDNDVFLWEKLPERIHKAEVFAAHGEGEAYHWYNTEDFLKTIPYTGILKEVKNLPTYALNMGIFGGCNLDFISKYINAAYDIAFNNQNIDIWFNGSSHNNAKWHRSWIIEQYILAVCCEHYNIKPELLFEDWPSEEQASKQHFTHLMIHKSNPAIMEKIRFIASKLTQ